MSLGLIDKLYFLLSSPICVFIITTLMGYFIFSNFRRLLKTKRNIPEWGCMIVACVNGALSALAEIMTESNASPRTIALYIPIMLFLELLIFGVPGIWGGLVIISMFSFAASTLYSGSVAILSVLPEISSLHMRAEHVMPVTMSSLIIAFLLFEHKMYQGKRLNFTDLRTVVQTREYSGTMFVYMVINSILVTSVHYANSVYIYDETISAAFRRNISFNMYTKDTIIFIFGVLVMIYQCNKVRLDRENKELEENLEAEQGYRKSLQSKSIFRFGYNMTEDKIIEGQKFFKKYVKNNNEGEPIYDAKRLMSIFCEKCIHPDFVEKLESYGSEEMALQALEEDAVKNEVALMSPEEFTFFGPIEDETLEIFEYEDEDYIWINFRGVYIKDKTGDLILYIDLYDVNEEIKNQEDMRILATTDNLTGLLNRHEFKRQVSGHIGEHARSGVLFMIDLDNFKSVNDILGHPKGDEVLIETAELIKGFFRPNDFVCRIGGDEFCVFATGYFDKQILDKRVDDLNKKGVRTYKSEDGQEITVSFSIGISMCPDDDNNMEDLYEKADVALYSAKTAGKNCHRFYIDITK